MTTKTMQASFEKMLREQSKEVDPSKPTENQVKIALLAFAGMTLGDIRTEAQTDIETVGKAIRAVRDAIRVGKTPPEIAAQFPDLVVEQSTFAKPRAGRASPQLVAKLNAASRGLDKPQPGRLSHWVDTVKERFAHIMVPLTMRKLAEAVERGEPEAVKLASQSFLILPGSKGTMIAQKFEFGGPGGQAQLPAPPPLDSGSSPYFEDILRNARAKIDAGKAELTAGDMPEPETEEEEDEVEA